MIHLPIPPLSEDRRRDLVRIVRQRVEDSRVAARNVRRDVHDDLRALLKEKAASEDDVKRGEQRLQTVTDEHIATIDQLGASKESEVMEI